jgi:hypothetical protein
VCSYTLYFASCSQTFWLYRQLTELHTNTVLHYILLNILTPRSPVLLEKLVKKFPTFCGTRRFIIAFTSADTCPYPEPDKSSSVLSDTTSWISILILSPSTSRSSKSFLLLRSPHQNSVRNSPISHTCYTPRPFHSTWFGCSNFLKHRTKTVLIWCLFIKHESHSMSWNWNSTLMEALQFLYHNISEFLKFESSFEWS